MRSGGGGGVGEAALLKYAGIHPLSSPARPTHARTNVCLRGISTLSTK